MFIIIILAIGLLSYTLADRKECVTFTFNIKAITIHTGNTYYTDETLSFKFDNTTNTDGQIASDRNFTINCDTK